MSTEVSRAHFVGARLQEIRSEISIRFIEMGQLLLEAFRSHYHRELGYDTFEAFVEAKLDMSFRRAKYLLDIYDVMIDKLQLPSEEVAEVGWTKAKELLPVINEDNKEAWVGYAKTHKTAEINLEVRRSQATPDEAGQMRAYINLTFGVFEDERDRILAAVNLAKLEGGTERPGKALLLICEEYAAEASARQIEALGGEGAVEEVGPGFHESPGEVMEAEVVEAEHGDS